MSTLAAFHHRFEAAPESGAAPLLLLHGTGGDENDLIDLGRAVAPKAALLSPRGNVLEHGMPRFFRRLAEGVFDEDDVRRRAHELADFVMVARKQYGLAAPFALGYSNGANIAAAVLLLRPEALAGAVLLRAMVPLKDAPRPDLGGKPVLIAAGEHDPIAPPREAAQLGSILRAAGGAVDVKSLPASHGLSQLDVAITKDWLARHANAPAAMLV